MSGKFYVYTWDTDRQKFTPQQGVRCGPYSKWGLRHALRKIRGCGFDVSPRRNANSVYVVKKAKAVPA